jgi:hypothetical protein
VSSAELSESGAFAGDMSISISVNVLVCVFDIARIIQYISATIYFSDSPFYFSEEALRRSLSNEVNVLCTQLHLPQPAI